MMELNSRDLAKLQERVKKNDYSDESEDDLDVRVFESEFKMMGKDWEEAHERTQILRTILQMLIEGSIENRFYSHGELIEINTQIIKSVKKEE